MFSNRSQMTSTWGPHSILSRLYTTFKPPFRQWLARLKTAFNARGVHPIVAYMGRLQVVISLVEVCERVRRSVISVCKRAQNGLQMHSIERSVFVVYSYFWNSAFRAVKRDAEFYSTFVNRRYTKEVPFLSVNELLYIVLTTRLRIGWEPTANFGNQRKLQVSQLCAGR